MFTKDSSINITKQFCFKMIFMISFPLNVTLFSKSPYLTPHMKINYETGCIVLKRQRDISRTIATAKMEFFVAIVSNFHSLTNFTKNPNIDAMGVLNVPLEHFNVF